MKRLLITLLLCLSITAVKGTLPTYFETYKQIAIEEMHKSGVPASITLAQGYLESGKGVSELATKSNNHFGIKCKKSWTGEKVYHDDDAKGECFRKYDSVLASYRDHSEFLKSRPWYAPLFKLERTDYKGWAVGLKQAGYATNPKYPVLLVSIIERYDLSRFDKVSYLDMAYMSVMRLFNS